MPAYHAIALISVGFAESYDSLDLHIPASPLRESWYNLHWNDLLHDKIISVENITYLFPADMGFFIMNPVTKRLWIIDAIRDLYYSDDYGKTWSFIDHLNSACYPNSISFTDNGTMFLACYRCLYRSADNGETFDLVLNTWAPAQGRIGMVCF